MAWMTESLRRHQVLDFLLLCNVNESGTDSSSAGSWYPDMMSRYVIPSTEVQDVVLGTLWNTRNARVERAEHPQK